MEEKTKYAAYTEILNNYSARNEQLSNRLVIHSTFSVSHHITFALCIYPIFENIYFT